MWEANRSSPNLKVKKEGHQLSQTASSGIDTAFGIPPAVLIDERKEHGVKKNKKNKSRCAFFEVRLEKIRGMVIIGWADRATYQSTYNNKKKSTELELGCTPTTWGIDSLGRIGTNNKWENYARKMKEGDWVGCSLDLRSGFCRFYINGICYGDALRVPIESADGNKAAMYYYPAITLRFRNTKILANFGNQGTPFRSIQLYHQHMNGLVNGNNIGDDLLVSTPMDSLDEEFLPLFLIAEEIKAASAKIAKKIELRNNRESLLYQRLPNETLFHCFTFLGLEELLNAAMTCRLFKKLASSQKLWLNLYYDTWHLSFPLVQNEVQTRNEKEDKDEEEEKEMRKKNEWKFSTSSFTSPSSLSCKAKDAVVCESLLGNKEPNEEIPLLPSAVCHIQHNFEHGIFASSRVPLYADETVRDIKVDRENVFLADGSNVTVLCRKTHTVLGAFVGHRLAVECLHLIKEPYTISLDEGQESLLLKEDRATYCITGSQDKSILCFNVENGLVVQRMQHAGPVVSIHSTIDGSDLAAITNANTVRIWDLETGQKKWEGSHLAKREVANGMFTSILNSSVKLTNDNLMLANNTDCIGIFDYRIKGDAALVNSIIPDSPWISSFDFNPVTNTLICSSLSTACPLQSISTLTQGGEVIKRMRTVGEGILSCKFEGEQGRGRNVICTTANALFVLDAQNGAVKSKISMPGITGWDRDPRYLYVAQNTGKVTEFDFLKPHPVNMEWKAKMMNDYFRFSRQNLHLVST